MNQGLREHYGNLKKKSLWNLFNSVLLVKTKFYLSGGSSSQNPQVFQCFRMPTEIQLFPKSSYSRSAKNLTDSMQFLREKKKNPKIFTLEPHPIYLITTQ